MGLPSVVTIAEAARRRLDGNCGLNAAERMVLNIIMRRAVDGQTTSCEELAEALGRSARQVTRHLPALQAKLLISVENRRPPVIRPSWFELAKFAENDQPPAQSATENAISSDLSRSNTANTGANSSDLSTLDPKAPDTRPSLARDAGHPAATAPPPRPALRRPAAGNPEPALPAARPIPMSDHEARLAATAAARWLRRDYEIKFPPGIRGQLQEIYARGMPEAEVIYAARETAECVRENPVRYFHSIIERRWELYLEAWPGLRHVPPPETGAEAAIEEDAPPSVPASIDEARGRLRRLS